MHSALSRTAKLKPVAYIYEFLFSELLLDLVGVEGIKQSKIFVNRKYIFYFIVIFQIRIQSL